MSVRSNSNYRQAEEEGDAELVLVAVTYTGSRSVYGPQGMRNDGDYPALDDFRGPGPGEQRGETKLVELPSHSLGWWENHSDFEVAYDEESVARHLLEQNYIPEQILGPGFDPAIREQLTEELGLDAFHTEDDLREQLRDVAGVDEDDAEADESDLGAATQARVDRLTNQHDRSVLVKVANSYEDVDGLLDEEDADSVTHLKSTAMAEFLADKDDDEADRRLATAEQGGEL